MTKHTPEARLQEIHDHFVPASYKPTETSSVWRAREDADEALDSLIRERDEMLEALQECHAMMTKPNPTLARALGDAPMPEVAKALRMAKTVLARIEGVE